MDIQSLKLEKSGVNLIGFPILPTFSLEQAVEFIESHDASHVPTVIVFPEHAIDIMAFNSHKTVDEILDVLVGLSSDTMALIPGTYDRYVKGKASIVSPVIVNKQIIGEHVKFSKLGSNDFEIKVFMVFGIRISVLVCLDIENSLVQAKLRDLDNGPEVIVNPTNIPLRNYDHNLPVAIKFGIAIDMVHEKLQEVMASIRSVLFRVDFASSQDYAKLGTSASISPTTISKPLLAIKSSI